MCISHHIFQNVKIGKVELMFYLNAMLCNGRYKSAYITVVLYLLGYFVNFTVM